MIQIDGAFGEGGGQVLRTALGLSLTTGKAFRIENIRAGRNKPGLLRQHLTAVQAAAEISGAAMEGAEMRSTQLTFRPGPVKPGSYRFAVGTAGSATLVFQAVLPGLLTAAGQFELVFEGGTHNPFAPPYDFLAEAFLPLLRKMGADVEAELNAYGFFPAGGGRITVKVTGVKALQPLSLMERGELSSLQAVCLVAKLPERIAREEAGIVAKKMNAFGLTPEQSKAVSVNSAGPGNVVLIKAPGEYVSEVFTAFGEKGKPLAQVAENAAELAIRHLENGAPVGTYLADQLLVPLALAGGGRFLTMTPSLHTRTNMEVIKHFLDVSIQCEQVNENQFKVEISNLS